MLKNGKSFSGRERNCCFLNTRGERFADVSTVSGLDFADDGRAAAIVDWDFDGDLDLWLVNRSGPQARFLRNDVQQRNRYLALRLVGTTCNRDAIGARVEVYVDGQPMLLKTLHAGDGFLSQSSKWLHFGLGTAEQIDRVVVRWPGGEPQTFTDLQPNGRYRLVQADPAGHAWTPPPRVVQLQPSQLPPTEASDPPRVVLTQPVPLPPLDYRRRDGGSGAVPDVFGRPTLLCLWASWCRPCIAELSELQKQREALKQAGIDVLALSVDGLHDERSGVTDAQALLDQLEFELPAGFASADLPEVLQTVQNELFDRHLPLGLPCSYLLDARGQLGAIYRGPVKPEQVVHDAKLLTLPTDKLLESALPFHGTWLEVPSPRRLLPIVGQLQAGGLTSHAWEYVNSHRTLLADDPELPRLLLGLGDDLINARMASHGVDAFRMAVEAAPDSSETHFTLALALLGLAGDPKGALDEFRRAADLDPNHAGARQQIAWILTTSRDPAIQDFEAAVGWAQDAVRLTNERDAAALDTLALAYAGQGRFADALKIERKALEAALGSKDSILIEQLRERIRQFEQQLGQRNGGTSNQPPR